MQDMKSVSYTHLDVYKRQEKTFGELKFTAVRDVFLQNEDGTPSTQLKKRIYDLKCSLHGGICLLYTSIVIKGIPTINTINDPESV